MHVRQHASIERHDISKPRIVDFVAAHDRRLAALENSDDASLGAALSVPLDARDDAIAVHRFREIGGRDVDILPFLSGLGLIGNDESESTGIGREPTDDEVHLLGQAVSIATDLKKFTGGHQCLQSTPEAGALVAWHTQHPHQIADRRRMMHVLSNLAQEVFSHESPFTYFQSE